MSIVHLQEGEHIILTVRKHWVVFLLESVLFLLAALAPFFLFGLYNFVNLEFLSVFSSEQLIAIVTFFICAWELLVFFIFCVALTNYYLDMLIITNKRLVDIDQLGLFSREVITVPIEKIQDIKIEVIGLLPVIFGFGNMFIQTAGEEKELIIKGIKSPHSTKEIILQTYQDIPTKEQL